MHTVLHMHTWHTLHSSTKWKMSLSSLSFSSLTVHVCCCHGNSGSSPSASSPAASAGWWLIPRGARSTQLCPCRGYVSFPSVCGGEGGECLSAWEYVRHWWMALWRMWKSEVKDQSWWEAGLELLGHTDKWWKFTPSVYGSMLDSYSCKRVDFPNWRPKLRESVETLVIQGMNKIRITLLFFLFIKKWSYIDVHL